MPEHGAGPRFLVFKRETAVGHGAHRREHQARQLPRGAARCCGVGRRQLTLEAAARGALVLDALAQTRQAQKVALVLHKRTDLPSECKHDKALVF